MKTHIWNESEAFPGKVNFVDSNNVILGYDLEQNCCEHAYWTISETPDGKNPIYEGDNGAPQEISLDGYCFDQSYFKREDDDASERYVATFKLIYVPKWKNPEKPDLFIRLVNHQNGYYSHGFTFRGLLIVEESL